jgi:hypothetical protein
MNKRLKYTGKAGAKASPSRQAGGIDLSSLFNVATQALAANQTSLNQADTTKTMAITWCKPSI